MLLTYLRLLLTAFFWAGVFHLGQIAVTLMSPLGAAAWRFAIAGLLFLPIVAWREGWDFTGLRRNAGVLTVMAVVGVFGFNVGLFYGLQTTSAMNGALIAALNPALTAVFAAAVNRQAPRPGQVLGLLLGLVGVAIVVSRGSLQAILNLHLSTGDAWVMFGALCWALYTALPQRYVKGLSSVQVAASTVIGGALLMIAFALAVAPDFPVPLPSLQAWAVIAAMAVFGSVIAYLWWNDGIKQVGPTQAAIFMNFVPFFAALISVGRGEHLHEAQVWGGVLVIAGVLCSTFVGRLGTQAREALRRT